MRCSLLSVALPLLLAFVPASFGGFGCAPASEEDADSSVDAVTRSSARLGPKAEAASDLANRLATTGFEKSTPFAMPLPGEIASKQFGAWKVAFVNDLAKKQRGFMFLPQENAPPGSFGLVLADDDEKIVATAAYVPDSAKNATKLVEQILQALPTDAKAIGATASIKPTGIYDKLLSEGLEIAVKLIAGARRGAGEAIGVASSAEAHLAPKVASSTWKTFASFVGDTKIMTQYLTEIAAARLTLKGRRVIMVETSEFGELGAGAAREAVASGIANTLTTRLGASSQKVALAVRGTAEHAAVVRWALEHDVPVVLGSLQQNAAEALVSLSHAVDGHDAYVFFVGASTNPKMLALIQNINVAKVDSTSTKMFEALDLTPVWAVSDEALSIRFGRHDGPFFGWLQRFEVSTRTTF